MKHSWQKLFPFTSQWHVLPNGFRMHYVETGHGSPVIMLHGNPTWSFMYRQLITDLETDYHAIAVDHLGCGLSDKPQHYDYSLQTHVENMEHFILQGLKLNKLTLVAHDWGGPVAMGFAARHPEMVRAIVLMNTVAWPSRDFPPAIYLTKCPLLGAWLVRGMNILMSVALRKMPVRKLAKDVRDGYLHPYRSYAERIAIQRFPQDIPITERHQSMKTFRWLEDSLPKIAERKIPVLLAWGEKDFCFPMRFLERWKSIFPHAVTRTYPHASHFLLEDSPEEVNTDIHQFLQGTLSADCP